MSDPACARCKKPLGRRWTLFLDRKYHDPVCYVVMRERYFELRESMGFDRMPLKEVNSWLDRLQYYDPSIHS